MKHSVGRQPVAAIVLNYNGWRDTVACVQSLLKVYMPKSLIGTGEPASTLPAELIYIVDNASTDDSVSEIRRRCNGARIIKSPGNGGFASGNNLAIRELMKKVDFIWLLNNDATCKPNSLEALMDVAGRDEATGVVGSVVMAPDGRDIQAWGGGRVYAALGISKHVRAPGRIDFITGASMLLRTSALEQTGILDEGFFLYWEDVDLCTRMARAGWKLTVAERSVIYHKEGASSSSSARRDRVTSASRVRYFGKHAALPMIPIILGMLLRMGVRLARLEPARAWAVLSSTVQAM